MDFDGVKKYEGFIMPKYCLEYFSNGCLEITSKWKSKASYRDKLFVTMYNVKGKNGMENSKDGNALEGFSRSFSKKITKKEYYFNI